LIEYTSRRSEGSMKRDAEALTGSPDWISSTQAADRLGVRLQTLYAYVSRGLLSSRRRPGLAGTWFDRRDVEAFARRKPLHHSPVRRTFAFKGVSTDVSRVDAGDLLYRGRDALALAEGHNFEEVRSWILGGGAVHPPSHIPSPAAARVVRRAVGALPRDTSVPARLRVGVTAASGVDPRRSDLSDRGLCESARRITAALLWSLSDREAGATAAASGWYDAYRTPVTPPLDAILERVVNGSLILLLDHGLAPSTVAARVAASTRADPYAVVAAGLAALDGPLHGGAPARVHELLGAVLGGRDAGSALADHVQACGGDVVGFGHPLYPEGDPRAAAILLSLARVPCAAAAIDALERLVAEIGNARLRPNVDSALAVLTRALEFPPEASSSLFAIARATGWIAHAREEYGEAPLRWRGG
jgi:citrate synthase